MARNSGVLIGQFLGNRSNPCADLLHHRKLLSNHARTLAGLTLNSIPSTTPSSPKTIIPSTSKPLPFSLHFLQHRRLSSPSNSVVLFSSPPEMVPIKTLNSYKTVIKEVKDGRLPAVFYFTEPLCAVECRPIIRKLREQFPHVKIYKVDMDQPTFHFYKNGRKVDHEIKLFVDDTDGGLEDTFAKLYKYVLPVDFTQLTRPSIIGKWKTRQFKTYYENGIEYVGGAAKSSQQSGRLVESTSAATSLRRVMNVVESLPIATDKGFKWYAKGLFKAEPENRAMFIEDPQLKTFWVFERMEEE